MRIITRALLALSVTIAPAARAQSACTYERCALRIEPRWSGLAAVRDTGNAAATLAFFWPSSISSALSDGAVGTPGRDSAIVYADRAFQARRTAAALSDGGLLLMGAAAAMAFTHQNSHRPAFILAGSGLAAFAVSVPLQFSADDLLGKSVWWYNRRFSR